MAEIIDMAKTHFTVYGIKYTNHHGLTDHGIKILKESLGQIKRKPCPSDERLSYDIWRVQSGLKPVYHDAKTMERYKKTKTSGASIY